ncbi:hypothetical protein [Enterobacter mori]|uniref:hypothetical protein n=1 Tax=Enterobacter mori TaxID=539813 RepID=UPI001B8AA9AE|nr:hypothetical protein [Enterobacter mori]MBS3049716.1 hypothetical protein [Enterobacter mori]
MNINPSVFSPLKILTPTYNWLSDKTKSLGDFVSAKILGLSNTNKGIPVKTSAGKEWKLDPVQRSKAFKCALFDIRVFGSIYTPPRENLSLETTNSLEGRITCKIEKKIFETAESQVFGMGEKGIRIPENQPKCIAASLDKFY